MHDPSRVVRPHVRYLVTGGAGFIGSHVVDRLLETGHEVSIVDDISTGSVLNLNPEARFIEGSVLNDELMFHEVAKVDAIVHLAAAVGVRRILDQPLTSFLTNITGTDNVLAAAARHDAVVFIASTSEIYGNAQEPPFREDAESIAGNPRVLRWGYSLSKAADEVLAFAYSRERQLNVVVGRLFNTVGSRQTGAFGMVMPTLIGSALSGDDLVVFGDGMQTRCFCHVDDVVSAILGLLGEPATFGEVFNIGSTQEVTIMSLAQRVIELSSSSSMIRLVPYESAFPPGMVDIRRRLPDISKIHSATGWSPQRELDSILEELISQGLAARNGALSG